MSKKQKPLPPLMAKAFADLTQAFDMSVPANLGNKFPFYVKGDEERQARQTESRAISVTSALLCAEGGEGSPMYAQATKSAPRGCVQNSVELVERLTLMARQNPSGTTGVARLLGISPGTLRPLLSGNYGQKEPRKIMAAYNAYIERVQSQLEQAAPAGPNPANLDKTGKRYVLAGCMVELPDLAMAKVGRVENGRWWLPCGQEPHPATCNEVRVLMRTFSESMGSFYWA